MAAALLGLTAALPAAAHARASHRGAAHTPLAPATFRLHVSGRPSPGTTFWVAYGPLADKWGTIRLHGTGGGNYAATATLPEKARSTFAYVAGQGRVRTPAGWAPGGPIVTIRLTGLVTAAQASAAMVQWQAPIG